MNKRAKNFIDLTGLVFGRLLVLKFDNVTSKKTYWLCECNCGNKTVVYSNKLKTGHTKSCGCIRIEKITKHGDYKTRFYRTYNAMFSRCARFKNYENISVSKRWSKYENFKADMYEEYNNHVEKFGIKNTTIDRIDSKKNYTLKNCRWATSEVQGNNTSRNRFVTHKGMTLTYAQWWRKSGTTINRATFSGRLKRGWSINDAARLTRKYNYKK